MADKRALSNLLRAMSDIALTRGDAPIVLVAQRPEGDPFALPRKISDLAAAMSYEPTTVYLADWTLDNLQPGSGGGASLARHRGPDGFVVIDTRTNARGVFAGHVRQDVLQAALDRVNDAPMRRSPVVVVLPDHDGDVLDATATSIREAMATAAPNVVTVQL